MRPRVLILLILIVSLVAFFLQFYRDPERTIPQGEGIIVSPADGRVIEIATIRGGDVPVVVKNGTRTPLPELRGYIEGDMTILTIFMSPTDVHVNRAPIAGRIEKIIHLRGTFLSAEEPVYAQNERAIHVIEGEERVIVIQVAGMVVRRIHIYKAEGDTVERGERIGAISFGSQVVVIFPSCYATVVSVGDIVYAGETILAEFVSQKTYTSPRAVLRNQATVSASPPPADNRRHAAYLLAHSFYVR